MIPENGGLWKSNFSDGIYILINTEVKPRNVYVYNLFSLKHEAFHKQVSPFGGVPSHFTVLLE